jgi:hypothetical protein
MGHIQKNIYRGGLIFMVLAHTLYLLTYSILEGLDKDTHIHGDVNRELKVSLAAQTWAPTSSGWWSHRVC